MRHSGIFGAVIEQALTNGTMVQFRAEGSSMYPTIRDGETITIAPVSTEEIVRGDVLLCRHGARVLAHRLVGKTRCGAEHFFVLQGDAKAGCDAPVEASAIVGKVVNVVRGGRVVRLCGRAPRIRRAARVAASRAKHFG